MGDETAEPSVTFSREELSVLADTFGLDLDHVVGVVDWRVEPAALRSSVQRGLVARGAGVFGVGRSFDPLPVLGVLLQVLEGPELVARATRRIGRHVAGCTWAVTLQLSVSVEDLDDGLFRLTVSETSEWFDQLLDFSVLTERPVIESGEATFRAKDFVALGAAERGPDRAATLARVVVEPEQRRSLERFAAALDVEVSRTEVEVIYLETETVLTGGELAWLDGGRQGLWEIPVAELVTDLDDLQDLVVSVAPTTADAIAAELRSYLPPGAAGGSASS